jgi:hypothetical protein
VGDLAEGFSVGEVNISFPIDASETAQGFVDGFISGIKRQVMKVKELDSEGATILIMSGMVLVGILYIWRRV